MQPFTVENFHDEAFHADRPVVVMFTAPHCAACRGMKPHLEKLAKELNVKVGTVDITTEAEIAEHFKVSSLPTTLIIVGHEARVKWVGGASYHQLRKEVKEAVAEAA